MNENGKTFKDSIVLPSGTKLPDSEEVKVETVLTAADDSFVAVVEKLAKPRPHLPKDYALNHGHYSSVVKLHPSDL